MMKSFSRDWTASFLWQHKMEGRGDSLEMPLEHWERVQPLQVLGAVGHFFVFITAFRKISECIWDNKSSLENVT